MSAPGYKVEISTLSIGGIDYRIRALSDRQQFSDPDGSAERAGVSPASWPIFGVIWPSGRALAEAMATFAVEGQRVLELGCGLGLASLVLQRRRADITASDYHPLAGEFLQANAALNDLPPIAFRQAAWSEPQPELGRFDLIVASDVLYERDHPALVAGFVERHAARQAAVVVVDPGRGRCGQLTRLLAAAGFDATEQRLAFAPSELPPFRGRLLTYRRAG
jgi:predicted nicotinamide N-methyase